MRQYLLVVHMRSVHVEFEIIDWYALPVKMSIKLPEVLVCAYVQIRDVTLVRGSTRRSDPDLDGDSLP